jgi:LPXTG-site transpeptidase (sortase) family protein
MEKVIATARYTLEDNWSIFSGFLLALFAIAGMTFAIFQPVSLSIKLPPKHGVGALAAPLKPFRTQIENVEVMPVFEEMTVIPKKQTIDPVKEIPVQAVTSPTNRAEVDPIKVNPGSPKPENSTVIHPGSETPVRIMISSIGLDAPIVPSEIDFKNIAGKEYMQWYVPDEFASGWHSTSAKLGEPGNTVLNGHHNSYGEVFKSLIDVNEGDIIRVNSEQSWFIYQITNKMILPEKYEQLDVRMNNAQWILPSVDERLTLISCWPYESNTHRLIIVARPLARAEITPNMD